MDCAFAIRLVTTDFALRNTKETSPGEVAALEPFTVAPRNALQKCENRVMNVHMLAGELGIR